MSALSGTAGGRPAAAFWKHLPVADQAVETFVEATLAYQRTVGSDVVKITPAGTYQATRFGLVDAWQGDPLGRRAIMHRPVSEPVQWRSLSGRDLGALEEVALKAANAVRAELGAGQPLIATVFCPASMAMQLAGPERLDEHLRSAPTELAEGVSILADSAAELIRAFATAGVDGIYYVDQHSAQPALHRFAAWIRELGLEARCIEASQGLPIRIRHYHGGPIEPGLVARDRGWTLHFEWAAEAGGQQMPTNGTAGNRAVRLETSEIERLRDPQAMRAAIRRRMEDAGLPNALITAPCVIPRDMPDTILRAWMDAVRGWP